MILTGGNDLADIGRRRSGAGRRRKCAARSRRAARALPVLGVCRGMQVIQQRFGIQLRRVEGHVAKCQVIQVNGEPREVNSYHHFAAFDSRPPLDVWAVADDNVVKAVRHSDQADDGHHVASGALEPILSCRCRLVPGRYSGLNECAHLFSPRGAAAAWGLSATIGPNALSNSKAGR